MKYARMLLGASLLLAGCAASSSPAPADAVELQTGSSCVFPGTFDQILHTRALRIQPTVDWMLPEVKRRGLDDDQAFGKMLVDAVRIAKSQIDTMEEAFAAVDNGVIHAKNIFDKPGVRTFNSFDFKIDGKTYGAILDAETGGRVAKIVDAGVESCTVKPATCVFEESFKKTLSAPNLERIEGKTLIASSKGLSPERAAQLLAASNVGMGSRPFESVEEAFQHVDESFSVWVLRNTARDETFTSVEYVSGNGDTLTGAILRGDTTEVVATYDDGTMTGNCTVFRP